MSQPARSGQPARSARSKDSVAGRLRRLAAASSTGTLPFAGASEGTIVFRQGLVVAAESSGTPGRGAGWSPAASPRLALAQAGVEEAPAPLARALAETEPMIDAVLDLMSGRSSPSRFRSAKGRGTPPAGQGTPPAAGLQVEALLGEVRRRQHLLAQMSGSLTPDTVVRRNPELASPRVQVSALQWALIIRAGAWTTPRELAWQLGRSVFGTTAEVYRLMALRLLSVADDQGPAAGQLPPEPSERGPLALSFIQAATADGGGQPMPSVSSAAGARRARAAASQPRPG
jgi:hypothetical protein